MRQQRQVGKDGNPYRFGLARLFPAAGNGNGILSFRLRDNKSEESLARLAAKKRRDPISPELLVNIPLSVNTITWVSNYSSAFGAKRSRPCLTQVRERERQKQNETPATRNRLECLVAP